MLLRQELVRTLNEGQKGFRAKIKITPRDLEIIRFCLEMRFATTKQIYRKFFKTTSGGEQSVSDRWAMERISKLKQLEFLKPKKNFLTGESILLPGPKGYLLAKNLLHAEDLPRPLDSIDIRQFEHDRMLIDCRLKLEEEGKITNWVSERSILMRKDLRDAFGDETIADGIGISNNGDAFFFELELSLKSKERYQKKIKRYLYLLKQEKVVFPGLKKVHFVFAKGIVGQHLMRETKLYPELFTIESLSNYQTLQTNKNLTRKG